MNINPAVLLTASSCLLALILGVSANADDKPTQTFAGWTSFIDPDKDCEFRLAADKLNITVPPQNHNLHPVRGQNAPRVLKKVSGDFTVQVKVTSDFHPGPLSTKPQGQGRPFNGAGLLIWQSEDNYLRIERNAYWVDNKLYCYPPLIEYWHKREDSGFNNDPTDVPYFTGRSTWLKGHRQGKQMTVSISHDGKEWNEVKTFPVDFDDDLLVGVAAINSSNLPFTVEFEEFVIESK
jgi:regulation of enolase protein 1 (concanavalin A-like superfamily)